MDNFGDMDIKIDKKIFSRDNTNSDFSQKYQKSKNYENIDSQFSYNFPFITNNININNIKIQQIEDKNYFYFNDINNKSSNQLINNDINNFKNQSRFFHINENNINNSMPNGFAHSGNTNIYNNMNYNIDKSNINNNINKNENK